MKKNASNILIGYKTRSGLVFRLEGNEEIIVDSFNFRSVNNNVSYIGFISNKRFIFKQTKWVSFSGSGSSEMISSEIKYIYWKDIKGIVFGNIWNSNLRILGKVIDFSPEKKKVDWEMGKLFRGFGGLSYKNKKELEEILLPTLRDLCLENKIPFGTTKKYNKFSTIPFKETRSIIKEIRNKWQKNTLAILAVLLGITVALLGMATIWSIFSRNKSPDSYDYSTEITPKKKQLYSQQNRYDLMLIEFQNSYFDYCKKTSLYYLFRNYISNLNWEAYKQNNFEFIKVTGNITYNYQQTPVALYFNIENYTPEKSLRFNLVDSYLNNQRMSYELEDALLTSICNEY